MPVDSQDTIVAWASAAGIGARAIIRLSGPAAGRVARAAFHPKQAIDITLRRTYPGTVALPETASLPVELHFWPAPRSYTGQEMVELHVVSAPPLIEKLVTQLLNAGARAALPGEFTLRAFLAGKRDLPRAEAVQAVVEAGTRSDLRHSLAQLAGGVTRPLDGLREDLLSLLADVEAALDFADENLEFVARDQVLLRISKGLAQLTTLRRQLEQRSAGDRVFRAVFVGAANTGKSSLFNALAGRPAALISPQPGTTRDYLVRRLILSGSLVELIDTAGLLESTDDIDQQAQRLGQLQAREADLVFLCAERGIGAAIPPAGLTGEFVRVATKCDLGPASAGFVATSAVTGEGVATLKALLTERAKAAIVPPLAPSLSRCRHHVDAGLEHLRNAHAAVLFQDPAEILALELRASLDQIGAVAGAVYTDDLLDRIFSRFCIGK